MKIRVLLFAQLKEILNGHEIIIDVPEKTTVRRASEEIFRGAQGRAVDAMPLRYAVNEEFCEETSILQSNDTLAILTPVAGG